MKAASPIVIQPGEKSKNNVGKDMSKGIFISNDARSSLKILISDEEFEALKDHVNDLPDPEEQKKCFITNKFYKAKDGLMIPNTLMADAIEKNIDSADKLWTEFSKDKIITCKCGKKFKYNNSKEVMCPYCKDVTNIKKYSKKIKLPSSKKIAFKLYVKYLRRGC